MAIEYTIKIGQLPFTGEYVTNLAEQVGPGWELVSVIPVTNSPSSMSTSNICHYVFKRHWGVVDGVVQPMEPPWGSTDPNDIDISGNLK